jgi:threonyl-tRNA synthetase
MSAKRREEIVGRIESKKIILLPDGKEVELSEENLNSHEIEKFPELVAMGMVELGIKQSDQELPSIKAMQKLELVDYEPASDKGHFRFYPKGALVFDLLRLWAEEIAIDRLESYSIITPLIYDWSQDDIRSQAESFHERHYRVFAPNDDKKFILRFAGDFGLFRMMKDAQLTYRHLPVRLFEFAPSFRYEQSGELSGLKRLRAFWMPDIHSFCMNLEQGMQEYKELYKRYTELANGMGVDYAVAFRVVESFYRENKAEILEMANFSGSPVLIELLSEMKHYWVMKHEINTIDFCDGVCQVSTVQLDIKDASLYGINFIDRDGNSKGCTIVHSSIGSPERWIFSILENALKKKPPMLPMWLAPIQARILPISNEKHLDFCVGVAEKLKKNQIRTDVDDRSNSLSWKIRAAEREWIPYIIVCGEQEQNKNQLSVRARGEEQMKEMSILDFISMVNSQIKGMPFRSLPGLLVSKKPIFRGRD